MLDSHENGDGRYGTYVVRAHTERAKMFSALVSGTGAGLAKIARRIARVLGRAGLNLVSGVVQTRRRHVAMRELQALDDRLLEDIGISRSQIPILVDKLLSAEWGVATGSSENAKTAALPNQDARASRPDKESRRAA